MAFGGEINVKIINEVSGCNKSCDWSLILMCISYFSSDLWIEELAVKFILYSTIYS